MSSKVVAAPVGRGVPSREVAFEREFVTERAERDDQFGSVGTRPYSLPLLIDVSRGARRAGRPRGSGRR
ncbi:hypothetical protein [Nonomuraea dietziae]|uniref:hypothetical protein n=1 Tax=Nonomuraea dietziae TaxID=65515 RepID=UPI0031E41363